MIDENTRGTTGRFPNSTPVNQPTGPIKSPGQPTTPRTESWKYGNKPIKEIINNVVVPDQLSAVNNWRNNLSAKNVFDAEINRDTAVLTLTVKLKFNFPDTYKGVKYIEHKGQTGYPVFYELKNPVLWDNFPKRKEGFIYKFSQLIETFWSNRMKLYPVSYCNEPIKTFKTAIKVLPVTSNQHHTAEIHFDQDVELVWNSRFNETLPENFIHPRYDPASQKLIISESDIIPMKRTQNTLPSYFGTHHSAAWHEFGHLIGLMHINEVATNLDQSKNPYGETVDQKSDVMGSGGIVSAQDMYPFLVAMKQFTGCEWEAKP